MSYFPFFIDIENAKGLVIGGGKQALLKVEKLLAYGPRIYVISREISEELKAMNEAGDIGICERDFQESDLEPRPDFVIAACKDRKEREEIVKLCRKKHILVNSVDDIEHCDFIFPSLIQKGKLSIGLTTSGASPVAGIELKRQIMELIPDNIEEILEWIELIRPEMLAKYPEEKERAEAFRIIYESMLKQ